MSAPDLFRRGMDHFSDPGPGASQPWLESVLDLLPFPFLLVEPGSGAVRFANRAARAVPLEPPTPSDGEPVPHAADEEGRPLPADRLPHRRAARGEPLDGAQVTWHFPDGGSVSYLAFSGTVPALHGQPPMTVLTFLDVTRLKVTEGELRQAVHARDEFFSVATHELKDPLAALQLSVSLLQFLAQRHGTVPADTLRQQLEVSKRQADRLNRLIENLLDVSRIANKRLQLDVEAFDLAELARDSAHRFEAQARSSGSTIRVEDGEPAIGYWDRMKLDQVLSNLLSNAIKYGNGKPIVVRVRPSADTVLLEVQDHGIGIAEDDQSRVFERFERVTNEHRRQSLGLGLYIVRSIVEAHGGTMTLRSKPGDGSVFTAVLPRMRLHHSQPPDAAREG